MSFGIDRTIRHSGFFFLMRIRKKNTGIHDLTPTSFPTRGFRSFSGDAYAIRTWTKEMQSISYIGRICKSPRKNRNDVVVCFLVLIFLIVAESYVSISTIGCYFYESNRKESFVFFSFLGVCCRNSIPFSTGHLSVTFSNYDGCTSHRKASGNST